MKKLLLISTGVCLLVSGNVIAGTPLGPNQLGQVWGGPPSHPTYMMKSMMPSVPNIGQQLQEQQQNFLKGQQDAYLSARAKQFERDKALFKPSPLLKPSPSPKPSPSFKQPRLSKK